MEFFVLFPVFSWIRPLFASKWIHEITRKRHKSSSLIGPPIKITHHINESMNQ